MHAASCQLDVVVPKLYVLKCMLCGCVAVWLHACLLVYVIAAIMITGGCVSSMQNAMKFVSMFLSYHQEKKVLLFGCMIYDDENDHGMVLILSVSSVNFFQGLVVVYQKIEGHTKPTRHRALYLTSQGEV